MIALAQQPSPSGFLSPLWIETLDLPVSQRPFCLLAPLVYHSDLIGHIEVPKGYRTDFASVPRFFWRILPPTGRYSRAAVVHDYLCDTRPVDSKTAAEVFLEAMKHARVPVWKRTIMYRAVRHFGPKFTPRLIPD